jgi:hypothetical protein
MKLEDYIACDTFEICKRFQVYLEPLNDYLVKRVGLDLVIKRVPAKVVLGKRVYTRFSHRIFRLFHSLRFRRRHHYHLKTEYHEPEHV